MYDEFVCSGLKAMRLRLSYRLAIPIPRAYNVPYGIQAIPKYLHYRAPRTQISREMRLDGFLKSITHIVLELLGRSNNSGFTQDQVLYKPKMFSKL